MKENLKQLLMNNHKPYIQDQDIMFALKTGANSRYALIKRARKENVITPLKKGFYIIEHPYSKEKANLFEVAQLLYGPSYISLESALSYHQWIPEGVYSITSVAPLRKKEFKTHLGLFSFHHVPIKHFYLEVNRIDTNNVSFFISEPWRALADYLYIYKKSWESLKEISMDLRVELETLFSSNIDSLTVLAQHYPSVHVRKQLNIYLKELQYAKK